MSSFRPTEKYHFNSLDSNCEWRSRPLKWVGVTLTTVRQKSAYPHFVASEVGRRVLDCNVTIFEFMLSRTCVWYIDQDIVNLF